MTAAKVIWRNYPDKNPQYALELFDFAFSDQDAPQQQHHDHGDAGDRHGERPDAAAAEDLADALGGVGVPPADLAESGPGLPVDPDHRHAGLPGRVIGTISLGSIAVDYLENAAIAAMLRAGADSMTPQMVATANFWTTTKWSLAFVGAVTLLAGIALRLRRR